MPGRATALNLLPPADTHEGKIKSLLNVDAVTLIAAKEVRDRGPREGLAYVRHMHRESGSTIFAINSRDWSHQSQRTSLYGLACLVPARRRVAIDNHNSLIPLTFAGLVLGEMPRSVAQTVAGASLVGRTDSLVSRSLRRPCVHLTAEPFGVDNILYMRTDLWYGVRAGGSVGHVAGVVNGFRRTGIEVRAMSWERPLMIDESVEFIGADPDRLFINERELALLAYNRHLVSRIADVPEYAPDAVYARYALHCWAPAAIARKFEAPLIIEYNGSETWIGKNWGAGLRHPALSEKIERWVLGSADVISVVSRALKDELVGRGFDEKRIVVNPNCVDPVRFDPAIYPSDEINRLKADLGIPQGARVAGFIGTFSPWHGVEILAEAVPLAVRNCPGLHFLIIGSGDLFDEVKSRLKSAGVLDRVTFTGLVPQDEAPKYLLCADFFLSPTLPNEDGTPFFGSPTKLFEYMSLGKGIIASDLDQLGEILTDGETGLLVPPGDPNALAGAIERLCRDPDLSDRMGKAARELALREYTWDAHVGRLMDFLYSL